MTKSRPTKTRHPTNCGRAYCAERCLIAYLDSLIQYWTHTGKDWLAKPTQAVRSLIWESQQTGSRPCCQQWRLLAGLKLLASPNPHLKELSCVDQSPTPKPGSC